MIKTVCDCCGAETFKRDTFTETRIEILGRNVTLCPDCLEPIKKECEEAERAIRKAVKDSSRAIVSTIVQRFEALNTLELLGGDDPAPLTDTIVEDVIRRILSKGQPTVISANTSNWIGSLGNSAQLGSSIGLSSYANNVGASIGIDEDYIENLIDKKISERDSKRNDLLQNAQDTIEGS